MADPIYTSASPIAVNPADGELIGGAVFTVHAPDDTSFSTPLAVTDPISGVAINPLRSNSNGTLPAFKVAGDLPRVILKSGAFVTELVSLGGLVSAQIDAAGLSSSVVAAAIASSAAAAGSASAAAGSAGAAADALAEVQAKAAEVASVVATNDGIMKAVLENPEAGFTRELSATIGESVAPVAAAVAGKADASSVYTKVETENLLGGYAPESISLFNRMAVRPNADRRAAIDTLIVALKQSGIWGKLDGFYMFAAHTAQAGLLNWKGAGASLTAVNAPAFTVDRGFQGDGATQYLTAGATVEYVSYTPASLMLCVWPLTGEVNTAYLDAGAPYDARINSANVLGQISWRANDSTTRGGNVEGPPGMILVTRTGANAVKSYEDGGAVSSFASAQSLTTPNTAGVNFLRSGSAYSPRRLAMGAIGGGFTDSQSALFYNVVADYMSAVGVQ